LFGALWNVKPQQEGSLVFHVRKDVNAIYLAGYGGPLLMNGGFCGSSSPAGPDSCSGQYPSGTNVRFSGEYLGDRAVSNNVAMLNYMVGDNFLTPNQDGNNSKFGNGIEEGFVGHGLDYASGSYTGFSQTGAKHIRNFIFKHPEAGTRGYFLLFDELTGVSQGPVNLAFHPNASTRQEVTPLTEYTLPIGRRASADASTGLALFFSTAPGSISFHPGIIASAGSIGAYVPDYFLNSYPLTGSSKQIATVLFPYNQANPKAIMARVSGTGYSGATISQGTVVDTAFESTATSAVSVSGISAQAKATWFRQANSTLTAYFVRQGRSLTNSATPATGFSSAQDVSLYLNQTRGNIVSPGTSVTLFYPNIQSVSLNSNIIPSTITGSSFVTVTIPAGTHAIELITNASPPITPTPYHHQL
jgi:hypothetical protein